MLHNVSRARTKHKDILRIEANLLITEYCKMTGKPEEDSRIIKQAAEIIAGGGLVAIPTETVYGLAGSALIASSAEKIFAAKGRPSDNPLIVHISAPEDAERFAYTNETYYALAKRFMPGPLTVVLPKRDCIPMSVTGGLDTVAIRCPNHPVAQAIIRESGHPIAAPSANRSGIPSPTTGEHVRADMDGRIDMIIDGGPCAIGLESTVIAVNEGNCTILRPGDITAEMLSEVCGTVSVAKAVVDPSLAEKGKVLSPGMKYKHYAPNAEVVLVDADEDSFFRYVEEHGIGRYGVMVSADKKERVTGEFLSLGKSVKEASQRLFMLLREADEKKLTAVYAMLPPKTDEYLAFYNRIIRAAGGKITKI